MKKETVLEIEFVKVWDKWVWRITKQDEDIFERGKFFDEDLQVKSINGSSYGNNCLYLRGVVKEFDDDIEFCSLEEKQQIEEKVKAINEKYGKPKRWRAEYGEEYFCINSLGHIAFDAEDRQSKDDKRYSIGNYFQTRIQAEKALERVKKALREVDE